MKEKIVGIISAVLAVVFIIVIAIGLVSMDRKGPEITYPKDAVVTYEEGADKSILLKDVTAFDEKDGDVTDSLVVEGVYDFNNGIAKVVYVARDHSKNMVKTERMINYIKPEPEVKEEETTEEGEASAEGNGVANGEGNTQVADPNAAKRPKLVLTTHEATVTAGSEFNSLEYINEVSDDVDSAYTLFRRIYIVGDYDLNTPGTYQLTFCVTDSEGYTGNKEAFTLTVTPAPEVTTDANGQPVTQPATETTTSATSQVNNSASVQETAQNVTPSSVTAQ